MQRLAGKSAHVIRFAFIASLLAIGNDSAFAQVELTRLNPPVVSSGATATIKAEGKFPLWPLKIECDQPGLTITCTEKAGEFQVVAAATARGVAWIRLHDNHSATSLTPILIESNPILAETEPNEGLKQAIAAALPTTAIGKLEKNGDVDLWKISLRTGDQLVATLIANEIIQSPMDSLLQLVDHRGLVLAQAEDNRGIDPQLVFTAKKDGDYFVRVFCFPETPTGTIGFAGGANFLYALRLTTGPYLDHTLPIDEQFNSATAPIAFGWNLPAGIPLEIQSPTAIGPAVAYSPGATGWHWIRPPAKLENMLQLLEQAVAPEQAFDPPLRFSGHIAAPREVDRVRMKTKANQSYRAQIVSRKLGFKLDSVLRILKADGQTQIVRNDDSQRENFDAAVDFKTASDEEVIIEVSDLADSGGPHHAYELQVAPVSPQFAATVAADHFRIDAGKELEIPIAIDRQFGFASRIEFAAQSLPQGVTAAKVPSESKGDSAKSIKLKLVASADAPLYQGTIELTATPIDDASQPTAAAQPITFKLRPQIDLSQLWFTVAPSPP